jgi:hypothetical protein
VKLEKVKAKEVVKQEKEKAMGRQEREKAKGRLEKEKAMGNLHRHSKATSRKPVRFGPNFPILIPHRPYSPP